MQKMKGSSGRSDTGIISERPTNPAHFIGLGFEERFISQQKMRILWGNRYS
jgi:hypothetical protein